MAWLTTTTSTATRRTTSLHKLYTTDVSTRKHTRGGKELLRGCIYEPEEGEQQRERGLLEAVALWRHCSSSPLEARTSTPIKHTFCSVNFCHIHLCADSSHCTKVHGPNKWTENRNNWGVKRPHTTRTTALINNSILINLYEEYCWYTTIDLKDKLNWQERNRERGKFCLWIVPILNFNPYSDLSIWIINDSREGVKSIFSGNNMNFHYETLICSWAIVGLGQLGPTTNQGSIMKIHIVPRKDYKNHNKRRRTPK